ncbi:MAG: DmsC/YnfH family molybdoenzyme membrane anchor subunit, partial [Aquihabitans sp.]
LPAAGLTISTTRLELPADVPADTFSASDWNIAPEHPHWPLVWLTLVTQAALGVSVTAAWSPDSTSHRIAAFVFAAAGMAGALLHLGRPAMAWKALRNLRRSWLSREVALLSLYAAVAGLAVVVPAAAIVAAVAGTAGIFASARLYVVPGRPAWNTPLTVVRFYATALALGPIVTGYRTLAVVGIVVALAATVANWWRLSRSSDRAFVGSLRLDLDHFRSATVTRFVVLALALAGLALGGPLAVAFLLVAGGELLGRWLFFVTVVPLNMPGSFWRGAAGGNR